MGSGIAQVAAMAGHPVQLYDTQTTALEKSRAGLEKILNRLEEKGKLPQAAAVLERIHFTDQLADFSSCGLVIEAIVEKLEAKKTLFAELEATVPKDCILTTNTSSLPVTAIAAACNYPERVAGLHFFNPAPLMALVEVIPALQTDAALPEALKQLMSGWSKRPVIAKDTPGFIVNRVARPFYGEALRILEEGIADMATIDWAMTALGGFKMGPFTLMDYIGHDVNYVVTETVFKAFFYDPRYKPSFAQQRLLDAGWLGRKSGRGFYDYRESNQQTPAAGGSATSPTDPTNNATTDPATGAAIFERILFMLINEAVDALYLSIASRDDLELAMTKGVNYPKGLLRWCDELGVDKVLAGLDALYTRYHEDRYRASVLLRTMAAERKTFF